ncbi:MAG: hypothetical protein AABY64_07280 [Bdellovibrionota bacterium]
MFDMQLIHKDRAIAALWLVVHPEVAEIARVRILIDYLAQIKFFVP